MDTGRSRVDCVDDIFNVSSSETEQIKTFILDRGMSSIETYVRSIDYVSYSNPADPVLPNLNPMNFTFMVPTTTITRPDYFRISLMYLQTDEFLTFNADAICPYVIVTLTDQFQNKARFYVYLISPFDVHIHANAGLYNTIEPVETQFYPNGQVHFEMRNPFTGNLAFMPNQQMGLRFVVKFERK